MIVFQVGFFPSSCVDILIDKELDSKLIQHVMIQRPSKSEFTLSNLYRAFQGSRYCHGCHRIRENQGSLCSVR